MTAEPRGRVFQDATFEVGELRGRTLEHLLGFTSRTGSDDRPEMMFLKARGRPWQRFYLDAGIGFWEEWGEEDAFADYADLRRIDYGARFRVIGDRILGVSCRPVASGGPSRIALALSSAEIELRPLEPDDPESESVLRFSRL